MGPNRRAQERERAAARAKEEAARAEAERKAAAEAEKIVAIWNARQAGGRALWFYPTIGAHCRRFAVAHVLLPGMPRCGLGRSPHPRPSPRRGDLKSGPVTLLPAVLAACAFREA